MNTAFPVTHGSAAQRIEGELRRSIIALELAPGARLSAFDAESFIRASAAAGLLRIVR